jgi:hypothetical protein
MTPLELHVLRTLLGELHVPEMRQDIEKPANVRWLLRNVGVNNPRSNDLTEAIRLLLVLHRENIRGRQ